MKTKLLSLILFITIPFFSFSQTVDKEKIEKRREEIKAQKISFITEKVNFTPEEAQKFWPLYNEMQEKRNKMNGEYRSLRRENKETPNYQAINEAKINKNIKEAELEKEYYLKYKKILSEEKIYKLFRAEREFQRELLDRIQQRPPAAENKPTKK